MANNYKVEIKIEIVECEEEIQADPKKQKAGQYEYIITGDEGRNIDQCEQAVVSTNAEALRDALSNHLTEVSKQAVEEQGRKLEECEVKEYRVDGEVGRFTFETYRVKGKDGYDSGKLNPVLKGKEWHRTQGFKEIAYAHGTVEDSYRKTRELINRVRRQEAGTPSRTLKDNSEAEGKAVMKCLEQKADAILKEKGFSQEGKLEQKEKIKVRQEKVLLPSEQVEQAVKETAPAEKLEEEMNNNPVSYENLAESVNVSIDEVTVKRQKEERSQGQKEEQKRKYLHNTVSHIHNRKLKQLC